MTHIKDNVFAGMSDSGKFTRKKKLFFILLSTILLVGAIIGVVAGVASRKRSNDTPSHAILKSSCSNTRYPELCYSAIASVPGAAAKISTQKDVIEASLNLIIISVKRNYFTVKKILKTRKSLTKREKTALHDCLEMDDETLDELRKTKNELEEYPKKKSLNQYAEDLKILVSGAMTNQDTCIDGFSHDKADKEVRKLLLKGEMHVFHMLSNALAMICNLTNTDMLNQHPISGRNLVEENVNKIDSDGFPKWLSAGDRRLLQAPNVQPNVVVAADGSGNYRTVAAAVAAAPEGSSSRYIIRIKAGTYRENVEVPRKKSNIMFMGDGRRNTIITASRNVVDGSTTFNSYTVAVVGERFLARDITFQNTAGPSKGQAVALRVGADLSAFYQCDMLAYQDTLYVHSLRQFYVKCLVAGTVDFIFGNAAVVFQDCDLHARRPNRGQANMFTAQGRDDPNQNTGIVIQKCRIGATSDLLPVIGSIRSYLGRPWRRYSRTVVMQNTISNVIDPLGWNPWTGEFLNTLYYAEYQNTGAGAGTGNRVNWRGFRVLTNAADVQPFTVGRYLLRLQGMYVKEATNIVSQYVNKSHDTRLSYAINGCLDLLDYTTTELIWTQSAVEKPIGNASVLFSIDKFGCLSIKSALNAGGNTGTGVLGFDLKTWLSAALGNQDTCMDGFLGTSGSVQNSIAGSLKNVTTQVKNVLGMVRPVRPRHAYNERKLGSTDFPPWMSANDRRLLEAPTTGLSADVVVATDGSGNFTSISDAISTAPDNSTHRFVIYIKKGVYRENVEVKKKKKNLMIVGDVGIGFIARDIAFENTAGPEKHQAVAYRSDSDLSVLYRCGFYGYQDTLYAHSLRQFYRECVITGTVDFIFGNSVVVFQGCRILAKKGLSSQQNIVTAHGRIDPDQNTGFSLQFCNISADSDLLPFVNSTPTYLGRPWKQYSRTVFMQSYMTSAIKPKGWLEWDGDFALSTLYYGEFLNFGPGAALRGRVNWTGYHAKMTPTQAATFTVAQFIDGNLWLPKTGVKYTAGLV
ncbi:hypothetical protein IFM89_039664 [Coptis chinensis]|uniref:pectinesterase n=1 Tax=Coptis chinensis TaxID=261450 RepID=A0A835GUR4_9MAGN|nr:hypothetical protein IFM89_039664 [Coptis chinensis]